MSLEDRHGPFWVDKVLEVVCLVECLARACHAHGSLATLLAPATMPVITPFASALASLTLRAPMSLVQIWAVRFLPLALPARLWCGAHT